jgi:lysyl endopeptidase
MKLNYLRFTIALLVTTVICGFTSHAQISEGGIPLSFKANELAAQFDRRELAKPDLAQLAIEDQANVESQYPGPERMAVSVPVNLDMNTAGSWESLADGSGIWRLKITVPDALALGVYYDHFYMPGGSKLFLYNEAKTQVIGAFTSQNNPESGLFATEFIQGESVTLEYTEPAGTTEEAVISISEVAYAYRFISFTTDAGRDQSWPCMINVACSEGDGWGDQISSGARLSIKIGGSWYWCSGALINNTSNDRTPYLLTAAHCGEGSTAGDRNQWVFYFNYQSSTCTGNYGPSSSTVMGCTLKAADPVMTEFDGADYYLIKLNSTPPSSYNVYYSGWNRTNIGADSGVCIHHPNGDIKKISTYLTPMISSTQWNGTPTHWKVMWSQTENGRSIMQPGSSGSPIFDQDGLIMGDLSGGWTSNSCDNPSPAWYGKVYWGWDQAGSTPDVRLKDWLDPTNTGIEKQPGLSSHILPPVVDFTADTNYLLEYSSVQFHDLTTGNPALSWTWILPGATPDTSYEQNPIVTYTDFGTFDVTLTVENADGTDTEIKPGYMTVEQVLLPEADFSASQVEIIEGESIDFTDLSVNMPVEWGWSFAGGTPDTSNEQNPASIVYSVPGVYNVSLTSTNNAGSDIELKEGYITVNVGLPPVSDFYASATEIDINDTVNFFDLSTGEPTQWTWTFEGATPGTSAQQNPVNILYPTKGSFYVKLRTKNSFGNNTMLKEGYINVGDVSVKDMSKNPGMVIYPNPSHGELKVRLLGGMEAWGLGSMGAWGHGSMVSVEIINSTGIVIKMMNYDPASGDMTINLGDQPDGLYIVRISSDNHSVQRKLSLFK